MIKVSYSQEVIRIIDAAYVINFLKKAEGYEFSAVSDAKGVMRGRFCNIDKKAYTHFSSKILNSVSACLIFNQVSLVYGFETGILNVGNGLVDAGRVVVKDTKVVCKRIVDTESSDDFVFMFAKHKDHKGRDVFFAHMELSDGAFIVEGSGVITNLDKHGVPGGS
ncbi:hypothetical protein U6010_11290 [Pseudomonas aeruginosa]|uniref:hypothetical protein n=1 Tax=Pseudomonas aeruginosa TaxID=287 RepID=UPI002ADE8995|nr:hypothetical protein [Pseudomonas aeruginosa]MEA0989026.1 hypothetical protein [Pseudomonas aeruginosa]